MSEAASKPPRMTVDEFIVWSQDKPGRHELYGGEVIRMQAEREAHTTVKLCVAITLRNALAGHPSGCRAYTDGRTVRIDADMSFEPDAVVDCGPRDPDSLFAEQPVVVVEVISPSPSRIDSGLKFSSYFQLPSVMHYLVVNASKRVVIHHQRQGSAVLSTIKSERAGTGLLTLDPPGITIEVADFFANLPPLREEA